MKLKMETFFGNNYVPLRGKFRTVLFTSLLFTFRGLTQASLSEPTLNKCPGFIDERNSSSLDILLSIPGNLTNTDEAVDFMISKNVYTLPCKNTFLRNISWEDGRPLLKIKSKIKGERLMGSSKASSHFTHDGYFHDEFNYYRPSDYCVKSISDNGMQLSVCSVTCSKDGKICIPKCCGVDEILVYWNFTCKKTSEGNRWNPKIHSADNHYKEITEKELDRVHVQRQVLNCQYFHNWPLEDTPRPRKVPYPSDFKLRWKLVSNKRPIFLAKSRDWKDIPDGEYCVDGFANWGLAGNGTYSGDRDKHSVILLCPKENSTGERPFSPGRAKTYSSVLIIASIFPLLTTIIHLLLIDRQHLHGLTVLCHAISMFLFYIVQALAHIISLNPEIKGSKRGPFCISVALLLHYFCMTTFFWLSVMNFDLWLTFRSMRPVSKISKQLRRFRLYFCIGWGLPALLIGAFYTIDEVYRDETTEVKVPEYADGSCFVGTDSRGYYVYMPLALILAFNTILALWTFYIFYEFRKANVNTFSNKRAKSDKYSVRLFIKLFCVMGVAWSVELFSWFYNGEEKPWSVVVLDCVMFLQAIAIFFIFCVNRRTMKQLEEKYHCLRWLITPIRKNVWFLTTSVAEGPMEMTTPGSTPRKLSLSVTNNSRLDSSTLPRKASNSSISSNKYGRMDSITLDSDNESGVGTMESLNDIVEQAPAPDLLSNT